MHLTDHVSDTSHNNLSEWYGVKNEKNIALLFLINYYYSEITNLIF